MPTPPRPWTVTPHGEVEKLEENLWTVSSGVPGIPGLRRRMSIVRRSDGGLVFFNGIPVDDAALETLRALGRPTILVVPQRFHTLDVHAFRERLGVRVLAPRCDRERIARIVQVDGTFEDLPPDPAVELVTVAGFKTGEGMAIVRSNGRTSLLVADVVLNVPNGPGPSGLLFRMLGLTGNRPALPLPIRLRVVRDGKALRSRLEELALTPGLARIVPSHGAVVDRDPAGVLRRIAASL